MEQIKGLDTRKLRHRGLLGVTAKNGSGDPVSPPKKNKGTLEHETKEYVHNLDVFGSWFFYFFVGCWVGTNTLFFGLDAILRLFYLFVELWDIVGRSAIFLCHLSCHPKNRPVHDHSIFQLQRLVQGTFILTMLHMWAPLWNQKLVTFHSFCYLRARSLL